MKNCSLYILSLLILSLLSCHNKATQKSMLFIGSYTNGEASTGIYVYELNHDTKQLKELYTVDSIINPSFLKLSPNGSYLYAATKSQLKTYGTLTSFTIDSLTGKLTFINEVSAGGFNPVHIDISNDGLYLSNANYSGSSASLFKINNDGSLNEASQIFHIKDSSIVKGRQDASHIHSSNFSPDQKYLFAQDLGADKMHAFAFNKTKDNPLVLKNDLTVKTAPGNGPRHFTFHPNGKYGYGVGELDGKISKYNYSNGRLTLQKVYLSYSKLQDYYGTADIHISPDGNYLYASNRNSENTISIFKINAVNGDLTLVTHQSTHGEHPRNFAIDPSGNFLVVTNQFSNNVIIFERNLDTGLLKKLPQELTINNASSVQIRIYNNK